MIELGNGVFAPVFCDGTKWVREAQMAMAQCKVCIACKHKHPNPDTDKAPRLQGSWFLGACDYPDDDGWAVARDFESGCGTTHKGVEARRDFVHTQGLNLAIKFVCGPDKTAGRFPDPYYFGRDNPATWQYHPSDQDNPRDHVIGGDR